MLTSFFFQHVSTYTSLVCWNVVLKTRVIQHCRKCGRIFCDRCSSFRARLDPSDIVQDPIGTESSGSSSSQRVCHTCHEEIFAAVPPRLTTLGGNAIERIVVDQEHLTVPGGVTRRQSSSELSDLAE